MAGQGKNSPTVGDNGMMTAPGEVSQMLSSIDTICKLPKVSTDEELRERINWYFEYCVNNDVRPGVEQLALACGCDRRTLWDWQVGNSRNGSRRGEIIREAKQRLASFHETLMLYGKINPITAIFIAKNHYGYIDRTELSVVPSSNPLGDQMTADEIRKLTNDIPMDVDYSEFE